ncbi:hypothetical protein EAG14_20750 [Acidovorax sp. 1608163]|uniref:phospholipase D-like domain-containing protein n=1 Tax=Acidovorax sp. 1608163 TaxID=2478662 RepID=UPI000EF66665|nr:phospholipase D-like domain-containing protein [Acidovorax sp. 1608163]AYM98107.1 hypothetical protein EAG14_20750 [Acidovorax sp. 1608163]
MQRLLYHAPDNPNQDSPFDRAIVQVVQGQNVSIVSPYIGLHYLHRLIGLSDSWRLISDVLEWLSATPAKERGAVYEFLREHDGSVHHYPAIHAKTVVSRVGAYTGSANLTDAGVLRRTEFGVLLTDPEQVGEVQHWFDSIWSQTSPPPLQSVQDLIAELNQISHVAADFADLKATQLESGARRVRAKLVKILGHEPLTVIERVAQSIGSESTAPAPAPAPAPATATATATVAVATPKPAVSVVPSPSTQLHSKAQLLSPSPPALGAPPAQPQSASFDLDAEIDAYVGRHAAQGFTFAQLHQSMRSKSPAVTFRETYFAILDACASHPRTLFSADAMHRLVYRDGRFAQSSKELLSEALKPLDGMLAEIINSLSFDEPSPGINVTAAQGISIGKQATVLEGMLQAGFVLEVDEGFLLARSAQWSPRLRLLERSHIRWTNRITQRSLSRAPGPNPEEASLGISNPSEVSTQLPVVEHVVESMEDDIEPPEVLIERRDHQKDMVFSYLAKLRHSAGEKTNVQMHLLIHGLVGRSGLSVEDVTRLLRGTYPMYRSPFLAMVTSNVLTVDIVADLDGNPHLQNLPLTRREIENSPILRGLLSPARPADITISKAKSGKAVRVPVTSVSEADEAYLQIVRWIFTAKPTAKPSTDKQLLRTLDASGVYRDNLRRLLFERSGRFPKLFMYQSKSKSLRLLHPILNHYPNTHSFLRGVVWQSSTGHPWLESPEQMRAALTTDARTNALSALRRRLSKRDTAYCTLLRFITTRVSKLDRFTTRDELVKKLSQSKLERFVIEYLLGIDGEPPQQLMRVRKGVNGFYIETDAKALASYAICRMFVEREVQQGAQLHPWLAVPAGLQGLAPPISFTPSLTGAAQTQFAPLQWEDKYHLAIDMLYVEFAKLFNERPSAGFGSSALQTQFREAAVAKYLKICEHRKHSGNKHEPVLSLEIHDGEQPKVEVVIYRGFRGYIHHYPKLERYLAQTAMKLREV